MLSELIIRDFAIIKDLEVNFTSGLNVLTGETGAGKSIIIDAVSLLLGDRAKSEYIRTGCEKAYIEGLFEVPENHKVLEKLTEFGLEKDEEDNLLILSREITKAGKNRCRINGKHVTLNIFRKIGKNLVDIHGQNNHESLLSEDKQLELLDSFGGAEILNLRREISEIYREISYKNKELEELLGYQRSGFREQDLLKFQLEEIEEANLKIDEEEELHKERKKLEGIKDLLVGSEKVCELLYNKEFSVYDNLTESIKIFENLVQYDESFKSLLDQLVDVLYIVEDVYRSTRSYKEEIDVDPLNLDFINERLDLINTLKRKYGSSIEEILEYKEKIKKELEKLENSSEKIKELEDEISTLNKLYEEKALSLSLARKKIAHKLQKEIETNLKELAMPNVIFKINLEKSSKKTLKGYDMVQFLFSSNPGEELKPLNKIASGGEMSRIMLAIKVILKEVDDIPVMIFDEVDTGVGGESIKKISEKLSKLAEKAQVICVTHSPNIAAAATTHFNISKKIKNNRTVTQIKKLSNQEAVEELTRMLGGTQAAKEHALSLKNQKIR